jgi:hypothetical protein
VLHAPVPKLLFILAGLILAWCAEVSQGELFSSVFLMLEVVQQLGIIRDVPEILNRIEKF